MAAGTAIRMGTLKRHAAAGGNVNLAIGLRVPEACCSPEFDFTPHRGLSLVRPGSAMRASGRANVAPNWSVRRLTRTRWRPRSTFPDYRVAINRHRHHNQALMRGQGLVSNGPTPEGLWWYDPDLKALAEAGHPEASPRLNSTRNRPGCFRGDRALRRLQRGYDLCSAARRITTAAPACRAADRHQSRAQAL